MSKFSEIEVNDALAAYRETHGWDAHDAVALQHGATEVEGIPELSRDALMATLSANGIKPPTLSTRDALNAMAHAKFDKPAGPNDLRDVAEGASSVSEAMNQMGTFANAARKLEK